MSDVCLEDEGALGTGDYDWTFVGSIDIPGGCSKFQPGFVSSQIIRPKVKKPNR